MMDATVPAQSPLYLFEKFEVGVVHLDAQRNVLAMNDFARKVLPVQQRQPFDKFVLAFHPERSRPKVNFMLDQAAVCPVANSLPMTMIINIPEQVLLIKVTRLADQHDALTGFVLVFYDVTQVVSNPEAPAAGAPATNRRLDRIPTLADQRIAFLETRDVLYLESDAHYTRIRTREGFQFCNLSISDLESRLAPEVFLRVHRCFIVNVQAIAELNREGSRTLIRLHQAPGITIPVSRSAVPTLKARLGVSGHQRG